jgi:hypothetical protein
VADPTEQELIAAQHLQRQGYRVHRCLRSSIPIKGGGYVSNGNDLWGCIDIMAKRRGERVRYIQVTGQPGIGQKKRDLLSVPWDVEYERVEIWKWIPGQPGGRPGPRAGRHFETYCLDDQYRTMTIEGPFPVPKRPIINESGRSTSSHSTKQPSSLPTPGSDDAPTLP